MAQRVLYPDHIEPLVQFVEETTPEQILARTHDKLAAGTSVHLVAAVQAAAISHGRIRDVYEHAAEVMHF
jgi:hypothetical protein